MAVMAVINHRGLVAPRKAGPAMIDLYAPDIAHEVMARWDASAERSRQASIAAVRRRVDAHMRLYYRKPLADMVTAADPGGWDDRAAMAHPDHSLQSCLFCAGPFKARYRYLDQPRDAITGRFASPYRSWRVLRAVELAG